jgi:hypothetical protein
MRLGDMFYLDALEAMQQAILSNLGETILF